MVLESLTNPITAEKNPLHMFFFGFLVNSIAIGISYKIFPSAVSIAMVFFTVLACAPLMYLTMKFEESKDLKFSDEKILMREHYKALKFLLYLFIGVTVSCALWYTFLPAGMEADFFELQQNTIRQINSAPTGQVIGSLGSMMTIFSNNVGVLLYCTIFSFIYGLGAIFIITWNATVIGTAIGQVLRTGFAKAISHVGFQKYWYYLSHTIYSFMKYAIHGIPEIAGYFIGGLSGGIISIAIINHHYKSKMFWNIMRDAAQLLLVAVIILLLSAMVEVYITPLIF